MRQLVIHHKTPFQCACSYEFLNDHHWCPFNPDKDLSEDGVLTSAKEGEVIPIASMHTVSGVISNITSRPKIRKWRSFIDTAIEVLWNKEHE